MPHTHSAPPSGAPGLRRPSPRGNRPITRGDQAHRACVPGAARAERAPAGLPSQRLPRCWRGLMPQGAPRRLQSPQSRQRPQRRPRRSAARWARPQCCPRPRSFRCPAARARQDGLRAALAPAPPQLPPQLPARVPPPAAAGGAASPQQGRPRSGLRRRAPCVLPQPGPPRGATEPP